MGAAKASCSPLMRQYGFAWPERMSCDRLPVLGRDAEVLCMDYNRSEATMAPTRPFLVKPTLSNLPGSPASGSDCAAGGPSVCTCREPFVPILKEAHPLYNKVRTGQVAAPCYQPSFSADEHTFATFWVGLWSVLCFISTSTTVATFLIDMECFRYPERPIIFLSACYLCVSLGFLVRLVVGHASVACSREHSHIHYKTTRPALCTVILLLVYFFGMASSIWWVILSLTWFLAAGMEWGNKAIAGYAQYFHLATWLIPNVKSITALALSSVDGDPVAGICYVGNQNLNLLRGFVLGPLVLYLLVGTLFLLAGFVSLFRIRSVIKQGGAKTDKLEKLMIRIGIFTLLYTVPASVVVACCLYEQHYRESWEATLTCTCPARTPASSAPSPSAGCSCSSILCASWWASRRASGFGPARLWSRSDASPAAAAVRGGGGAQEQRRLSRGGLRRGKRCAHGQDRAPSPAAAAAAYHKQVSLSHV
ncbi:hypothetical protein FD754_025119 [Muntiacus muntjak]|uniref:Frizzled-5 n=1 Tax=Muntiacus muntjak TaxID=9888 RepID=A0A5N3ULM2_MUNMU|nr:hypothetical protein FD754_025119 [Muntiacus muntjak]